MAGQSLLQRLKVSIVLIFVQACFSLYAIISHVLLSGQKTINPGVFILCRDVGCTLVLLTAGRIQAKKWMWPEKDDLIFFVGLGVCNVYFGQYYFVMGIKYTNALTASIWQNTIVVFTTLIGVASGVEVIKYKKLHGVLKILGVCFSLAGALGSTLLAHQPTTLSSINTTLCAALHPRPLAGANVTFSGPLFAGHAAAAAPNSTTAGPLGAVAEVQVRGCGGVTVVFPSAQKSEAMIGNVFFFLQCLFGSVFFLIQKTILEKYPPLQVTAWGYMFGAALMVLVVGPNSIDAADWELSTQDLLGILYVIFISSALCYALYAWANKQAGPVFVVIHSPIQIIFTALFRLLIFGTAVTKGDCVGGALVSVGLFVIVKGKLMEEEEQRRKLADLTPSSKARDISDLNRPFLPPPSPR